MNLSRLKLISSHGDQTLSEARFILYMTPSSDDTNDLLLSGLRFAEGQVITGTNLLQTIEGKQPDRVFVMAIPSQFHLGYAVFTTAYVDRALKRVVGAPISYADARKQLGLYMDHDVESARERIEAEVAEGYALDQRPTFLIEPNNIVGHFNITPAFHSTVARIRVATDSLNAADFQLIEDALNELFRPNEPASSVLASTVAGDLLVATVESSLMSRMRLMRWQGLKALGYAFYHGQHQIEFPAPDGGLAGHQQRLAELTKDVEATKFFAGRLAWLKQYVLTELRIMRVELDEGAGMQ